MVAEAESAMGWEEEEELGRLRSARAAEGGAHAGVSTSSDGDRATLSLALGRFFFGRGLRVGRESASMGRLLFGGRRSEPGPATIDLRPLLGEFEEEGTDFGVTKGVGFRAQGQGRHETFEVEEGQEEAPEPSARFITLREVDTSEGQPLYTDLHGIAGGVRDELAAAWLGLEGACRRWWPGGSDLGVRIGHLLGREADWIQAKVSELGWQCPSWVHKVLEVLPVLGVVALAVLGTFLYLGLEHGVWAVKREQYSLSCDTSEGYWARTLQRPLYAPSCPYIRDTWNCHKYGGAAQRPLDNWRWEPHQCLLPPFDAQQFLRVMRNRLVAFVGDESAANSFDSFVCMLAEADSPRLVQGSLERAGADATGDMVFSPPVEPERSSEEEPSGVAKKRRKSSWASVESWAFGFADTPVGQTDTESLPPVDSPPSQQGADIDSMSWGNAVMVYSFFAHNFTLALFESPLLVRIEQITPVNRSACDASKSLAGSAALAQDAADQGGRTDRSGAGQAVQHADPEETAGSSDGNTSWTLSSALPQSPSLAYLSACYPNPVYLDQVDPMWASQASTFDALILNSGRSWREEAVEERGLGLYRGGERLAGLSMEGFEGAWAYPLAMESVIKWLAEPQNFRGVAMFRSYIPGHRRRECAGHEILREHAAQSGVSEDGYDRYDYAVSAALGNTSIAFMNVSQLASLRGDGHPWMASPGRPRPDCESYCLPGVPDSWNELLAARLLHDFAESRPLRPLVERARVYRE